METLVSFPVSRWLWSVESSWLVLEPVLLELGGAALRFLRLMSTRLTSRMTTIITTPHTMPTYR